MGGSYGSSDINDWHLSEENQDAFLNYIYELSDSPTVEDKYLFVVTVTVYIEDGVSEPNDDIYLYFNATEDEALQLASYFTYNGEVVE